MVEEGGERRFSFFFFQAQGEVVSPRGRRLVADGGFFFFLSPSTPVIATWQQPSRVITDRDLALF